MRYDVPTVPDSLLEELAFSLGESGAQLWLADAVATAGDLIERWELVPHEVLSGGSCRCASSAAVRMVPSWS